MRLGARGAEPKEHQVSRHARGGPSRGNRAFASPLAGDSLIKSRRVYVKYKEQTNYSIKLFTRRPRGR